VIGLRADDDVDAWGAARDFGAFGLGDAAGDGDHRPRTVRPLQPADVRIDLFRRFLADVAGVEHDQIRLAASGRRHAPGLQQLRHPLAVIDVHLAAVGFDVECLGVGRFHRAPIGDPRLRRK
jgi:hypothetical protein